MYNEMGKKRKIDPGSDKVWIFTLLHKEEGYSGKMKEQTFEYTSCRIHKLICDALGHEIFIEDKNLARDKKITKAVF